MQLSATGRPAKLLALAATLCQLCSAVPIEDSPRQRLLMGLDLPSKYRTTNKDAPYTPGHEDKYDNAIDAIGEELDPLPWRNGEGATVLGPHNKERARQGPDLVRPPSTDKGAMANMRWSFVDSHTRIEVNFSAVNEAAADCTDPLPRKVAGPVRPPSVSSLPASSSLV